jgi:hypothetical protein
MSPTGNPVTSIVVGEAFTVHAEVKTPESPAVHTPTGTVTFKLFNSATSQTTVLGNATLTTAATGDAVASLVVSSGVAAGTYTLYYTYSGDGTFSSGTSGNQGVTVTAPSSSVPPPVAPNPSVCDCAGPIANAAGGILGGVSASGVDPATGAEPVVRKGS